MLHVSIGEHKLTHYCEGTPVKSYSISTSRRNPSCIENSLGSPWGLHKIADKIGDGEDKDMVFVGRKATGTLYQNYKLDNPERCLVVGRIMRLQGLDPELNLGGDHDSYNRYIYIHGTNHEDKIGTPLTHGCVALTNAEMVTLFDSVPEESLVWITRE